MAQPVAELAADVRPLVQRVHLVHADALELLLVALEHVEEPDRLAVGERNDQVGARADVVEHALRRDRCGQTSGHARSMTACAVFTRLALQHVAVVVRHHVEEVRHDAARGHEQGRARSAGEPRPARRRSRGCRERRAPRDCARRQRRSRAAARAAARRWAPRSPSTSGARAIPPPGRRCRSSRRPARSRNERARDVHLGVRRGEDVRAGALPACAVTPRRRRGRPGRARRSPPAASSAADAGLGRRERARGHAGEDRGADGGRLRHRGDAQRPAHHVGLDLVPEAAARLPVGDRDRARPRGRRAGRSRASAGTGTRRPRRSRGRGGRGRGAARCRGTTRAPGRPRTGPSRPRRRGRRAAPSAPGTRRRPPRRAARRRTRRRRSASRNQRSDVPVPTATISCR